MSNTQRLIASLGPVMQLAFVPADFDAAIRFWTKVMGAGPFFQNKHLRIDGWRYRGEAVDLDLAQAIGYWGDIQIEIMYQHNDAPSIFRPKPGSASDGLHHMAVRVENLDIARDVCVRAGAEIVQELAFPVGGVFYADTGGGPGTVIEILGLPPGGDAAFVYMRNQSRGWDGTDPVREQSSIPELRNDASEYR